MATEEEVLTIVDAFQNITPLKAWVTTQRNLKVPLYNLSGFSSRGAKAFGEKDVERAKAQLRDQVKAWFSEKRKVR